MKIIAVLLLVFLTLSVFASASELYQMGYNDGYAAGLEEGANDRVHGYKYKPYSYKRCREMYQGRPAKYNRGFKKGYRKGYRTAYKADETIVIERERIIVGE